MHGIPSKPFAGLMPRHTALAPHSVSGFVPGQGTLNIAPGLHTPPPTGQSAFTRHGDVVATEQNP